MQAETKICQNCKKDFTIEPEDFKFYEKIKVSPPTWCPQCRMERRMSFVNAWYVAFRNCDKCGQKTLSIYPPEQKITVYCSDCFWADDWDGTEYAMEYDPHKPFLQQVKELSEKVPFSPLDSLYKSLKNCEYTNGIAWSKDCYLTFWADYCDNVYYSSILDRLKYSADCLRAQNSELCYESIGISKCYQTFFSEECDDCVDVWFSRNCYNCTNCVGCVNLRGESNCIFNIKFSKEEYLEKLEELDLNSRKGESDIKEKAYKFWLTKPKREHNSNSLNKNVTGECVFNSKNSKEMYICVDAENCKYCQFITIPSSKDCWDYSGWGNNASQVYECQTVGEKADSIYFSSECWPDVFNLQYCIYNISCKNCFGCVNLKRKSNCILNKEYSKEEFEELKIQIIEDMKKNPYLDKTGHKYFYGEFFPTEFSEFGYNRSNAMRFFKKTKEQALEEGYGWSDMKDTLHKVSKLADSLPDKIIDTSEDILNEIIECQNCKRGYKIVQGELNLLRKMNLPVPHECPKCRENRRFDRMTKPIFYNRTCSKCGADIYTPYSPDRPDIVYCVKCYQEEFTKFNK